MELEGDLKDIVEKKKVCGLIVQFLRFGTILEMTRSLNWNDFSDTYIDRIHVRISSTNREAFGN